MLAYRPMQGQIMKISIWVVFVVIFCVNTSQVTRADYASIVRDTVVNIRSLIVSTTLDVPDESSEVAACRLSLENFTYDVTQKEPYALRVLDCDGKLESGVLLGRIVWRGEYFECHRIANDRFRGKWCALAVGEQLSQYVNVKRGLSIGICFPEKCSQDALNAGLDIVSNFTGIQLEVICPVQPTHWAAEDILSVVVIVFLGSLCIIGTIAHVLAERARPQDNRLPIDDVTSVTSATSTQLHPWLESGVLRSFSVSANTSKLIKETNDPDYIQAINGIRFLAMCLVILQHVFYIGFTVGDNPITLMHWFRRNVPSMVVLVGGSSVDIFFLMAGILVSYRGLKEIARKGGKIPIIKMYLIRYLRLTPSYALVILITVGFYSKVASGPRWPAYYSSLHLVCSNTWWTELLYFNNIYPYDSMNQCFSIGWYLACDFQYYIISPFFIILLHKNRNWGLAALVSAIASSTLTMAVMANVYDWQPDPVNTGKYSRQVDDAINANVTFNFEPLVPLTRASTVTDHYYFRPWTHASVYIIGMLIGYYLYENKKILRIHWTMNTLAWVAALTTSCSVVYGLFPHVSVGYDLSKLERTLYISLSQPALAVSLGWIIVACATGNGGLLNNILSWKLLAPLARLTYGMYLTHCMVLMIYFGSIEDIPMFSTNLFAMLFLALVILSVVASLMLWYLIEAPTANLLRIMVSRSRRITCDLAETEAQRSSS